MKINLDTFIISDTHFGHKNIIKYCDRPENHDEIMFNNWNKIVSDEDKILHLGDLTFKSNAYIDLKSLTGEKYLLLGNHDHKSHDWYAENGFQVVPKRLYFQHGDRRILFTHYPEDRFDIPWHVNIHGHIHNNSWVVKKENGRLFVNVSVEVMGYMPIKLRDILKEV